MDHQLEAPLTTAELARPLTLPDQLDRAVRLGPDKTAISHRERVIDYQTLQGQVYALANHLLALGLARGGRVGLLMDKSPEAIMAFLGVAAAGGVVFPMDPNQPRAYLQNVLDFTAPWALVVDERHQEVLEGLTLPLPPENIVVNGDQARGGAFIWAEVCARQGSARPALGLTPAEPVYLNFTSGTTGLPKGAVTTHLNIHHNTLAAVEALGLNSDDVHLCMFPVVAHPHELFARALMLGGSVALVDGIYPGALAKTIARHRVSAMMAVASIYETLVRATEAASYDLSSLRVPESGGMHVPPELLARFRQRFGATLLPVWGSTETCGIALAAPLDGGAPAGSMGRPLPGYQIKVLGEDGQELGPGQVGEMAVSGPAVCASYFNNPAETAKTLRQGWFHSGDLVKTDEEGYFYFMDRKARLLKVGGLKVFCAEIEQALMTHPAVAAVAVVRVANDLHGEMPQAFVELKPGEHTDAKALRRHLEGRLARYKHPRLYEFVASLPRNAAGKILWRQLQP